MARDFPPTGTLCCSWAFNPLLLWVLSPHLCDEACQPCPRSCGGTRGGLVRLFHVATGNTSCPDVNIGRSSAGLAISCYFGTFFLIETMVCLSWGFPEWPWARAKSFCSPTTYDQTQVSKMVFVPSKIFKSGFQSSCLDCLFFFFRFSSWSFFSVLFTWQLDHFGVLLL